MALSVYLYLYLISAPNICIWTWTVQLSSTEVFSLLVSWRNCFIHITYKQIANCRTYNSLTQLLNLNHLSFKFFSTRSLWNFLASFQSNLTEYTRYLANYLLKQRKQHPNKAAVVYSWQQPSSNILLDLK